jgi:hypothetical protein
MSDIPYTVMQRINSKHVLKADWEQKTKGEGRTGKVWGGEVAKKKRHIRLSRKCHGQRLGKGRKWNVRGSLREEN